MFRAKGGRGNGGGWGVGRSVDDLGGMLTWSERDSGDVVVARRMARVTNPSGRLRNLIDDSWCLSRRLVRWGVLGSVTVAQAEPCLLSCWRWDDHLNDAGL